MASLMRDLSYCALKMSSAEAAPPSDGCKFDASRADESRSVQRDPLSLTALPPFLARMLVQLASVPNVVLDLPFLCTQEEHLETAVVMSSYSSHFTYEEMGQILIERGGSLMHTILEILS